jgi:hypothetical protein
MTEQNHSEDIADLTAELKRVQGAYRIACLNVAELSEQRTALVNVLNTAGIMIEQLLADLRALGGIPSQSLLLAKMNFDRDMKKLIGIGASWQHIHDVQRKQQATPKDETKDDG